MYFELCALGKKFTRYVILTVTGDVMTEFSLDLQAVLKRLDILEAELRQLRQTLFLAEDIQPRTPTEHPYIESVPAILQGEPVIRDTRTPVRSIVERWKFGETPEEIARNLPHLRLAHIFDALGYYDDHREEIENYIETNRVSIND